MFISRIAIFYQNSFSGSLSPAGYLQQGTLPDSIFADDFESGDLSMWSTSATDASGTLKSQQRYLPFGQVRTDTNAPNTLLSPHPRPSPINGRGEKRKWPETSGRLPARSEALAE